MFQEFMETWQNSGGKDGIGPEVCFLGDYLARGAFRQQIPSAAGQRAQRTLQSGIEYTDRPIVRLWKLLGETGVSYRCT